jgi:hypothetical protein
LSKATAIGAAVAANDLETTVQAKFTGADTSLRPGVGDSTILADRVDALNLALAVGSAGGQSFALGGSVALVKDRSTMLAQASNRASVIDAKRRVSILVADSGNTNSVNAGSAAGTKAVAIGAAIATADLGPTFRATSWAGRR